MNQPSEERNVVLEQEHFRQLLEVLWGQGYCVVGPTVRAGAIVYDELRSAEELPRGWTDQQEGGTYRLQRRSDQALFGYASTPQSWKQVLHPSVHRLWRAKRTGRGFQVQEEKPDLPKYAFIGVRSCDLHSIAILD
ncbi:MAG TPA: hypothetical protein VNT26_01865, partial [Candidatus Sulfotelmatobacter sp.]|nr:hypothetical protein [Candidatus Sulfotelmatobacter sp.]